MRENDRDSWPKINTSIYVSGVRSNLNFRHVNREGRWEYKKHTNKQLNNHANATNELNTTESSCEDDNKKRKFCFYVK